MSVVTDDFNRADGSIGAAWTQSTGTWTIASNKARCLDDFGAIGYFARFDTDVGSVDMYAQAVITGTQGQGSSNGGVVSRAATAAHTGYYMTGNFNGNIMMMFRVVAGSETQMGFAGNNPGLSEAPVTWNSGDTLRLETVGNLQRGKVNGTLVLVSHDTNITTGQRGGLTGFNNVADDIVEADNFEAGSPVALTAPYVAGVSAQVGGTGTTLTPTAQGAATGDLLLAWATSKDAAQTVSAPASQGWALQENPSQTGLEGYVFAKRWGAGDTDDTTPTFSIGAGTAGWCITLITIRNPSHATAPWTSIADAIVIDGSQSNAASATVTAPSVSHTGDHRTVVRLFSSADDNALGLSGSAFTHSEGALVFGGAAFDVTSGGGVAQAMSILEDTTLSGSTGTATVTETAVGNDISNGVTLVLAIPSSAVTGTAAVTQGADTSVATGQLGYSATSGTTQAAQTSSAAGQLGYSGTASTSQADQTSAASGVVVAFGGTVAATQADQTSTAAGQLGYSASSAATQAAQTSAASGQLGYSGTSTTTQAGQTAAASGQLGYAGTSATVQADQTSAATGQLGYSGAVAATQAAQTSSASGIVTGEGFAGSVAVTQADQVAVGAGQLGYSGTSTASQASQTAVAGGQLGYVGTAAPVAANQTSAATGQLGYLGTASTSQANQTSAAAGTAGPPISGTVAVLQANQTSVAIGTSLAPGEVIVPRVAATYAEAFGGTFDEAPGVTYRGPVAVTFREQ